MARPFSAVRAYDADARTLQRIARGIEQDSKAPPEIKEAARELWELSAKLTTEAVRRRTSKNSDT